MRKRVAAVFNCSLSVMLCCFLRPSTMVSRCATRIAIARIFAASLSRIPLKGSYTAITEQLWWQREKAKLRCASATAPDKSTSMASKPRDDTVVVYDFPGDPRLKDEYSNPWGDVRCCFQLWAVASAKRERVTPEPGSVSFLRISMLLPVMSHSPTAMMKTPVLPRPFS